MIYGHTDSITHTLKLILALTDNKSRNLS